MLKVEISAWIDNAVIDFSCISLKEINNDWLYFTSTGKIYVINSGVGSPLPVGENFDSPLNFLLPGSSKTKFPPSGGFRLFGPN